MKKSGSIEDKHQFLLDCPVTIKHNTNSEHNARQDNGKRNFWTCMSTTDLHEQICFSKQGKSSTAFCELPNGCQGALQCAAQSHLFCHSLAADLLHSTSLGHSLSAGRAYHLLHDPACSQPNCEVSQSHSTMQSAVLSHRVEAAM